MNISEYLSTPEGQCKRHFWRKFIKQQYYSFETNPLSKNAMSEQNKRDFQHEILKQSQEQHRRAFKGRITANFFLNTNSKNPPHIHNAAKNIIDLFAKPIEGSSIRRKGLAYYDDNQIAYLMVNYNFGEEARISAKFGSFNNFMLDLEFAEKIISNQFDVDIDLNELLQAHGEFINSSLDELNVFEEKGMDFDLLTNKNDLIRFIGKETYQAMLHFSNIKKQNNFLKKSKLYISDVYLLYKLPEHFLQSNESQLKKAAKNLSTFDSELKQITKMLNDMNRHVKNWIAKSPVKIHLPSLPTRKGQGKDKFREQIIKALKQYKEKYKNIFPLLVPVALQIIYLPPKTTGGFYKDLDNLMKLILPIFHEEFKPPPTWLSATNLDHFGDSSFLTDLAPTNLIPRSVKYSVASYEVFELRRTNEEDDGFISIGITAANEPCIKDRIDNLIDDWYQLLTECQKSF